MQRLLLRAAGLISVGLGTVGLVLPLVPTVPFLLLAAFCFARSSPRLEAWLLDHPSYGPHLQAWRQSRAVSRRAKRTAWFAFSFSTAVGLATLPIWWNLVPALVAVIGSTWIARLPTAPAVGPVAASPRPREGEREPGPVRHAQALEKGCRIG